MGNVLTDADVAHYREHGFVTPVAGLARDEAARFRRSLEAMEYEHGGALDGIYQFKPHIHQKWAYDAATHPRVLGAVSDVIGPNVLIIQFTVWVKEPGSDAFVSWHQDGTYFGLHPSTTSLPGSHCPPATSKPDAWKSFRAVTGKVRVLPTVRNVRATC